MKKLFSFMLMATALLISGQVKAANATYSLNGGTAQPVEGSLVDLFKTIAETATPNLNAVIKLTDEEELGSDPNTSTIFQLKKNQTITLDLQGHALTINAVYLRMNNAHFNLINGSEDEVTVTFNDLASYNGFFQVFGSSDPMENYGYCDVTIGKNILVDMPHVTDNNHEWYFIAIFNNGYGGWDGNTLSKINGGTTINVEGTIQGKACISVNGGLVMDAQTQHAPIVNVSGKLKSYTEATGADVRTAIYGSGTAIWNISGSVEGQIGMYVKSGTINVTGKVESTGTTYTEPTGNSSGCSGGSGCAIIMDTRMANAGDMKLYVSGNAEIISGAGYAIAEKITEEGVSVSKTDAIVVESGSIDGTKGKGCLNTTATIATDGTVQLNGGDYKGEDISQYLSDNAFYVQVQTEDGTFAYKVDQMPKGQTKDDMVTDIEEGKYVKLNHVSKDVTSDIELPFLLLENGAKVTVKASATLTVGNMIISGEEAQLIIEAGAKVIAKGAQGIVSEFANNIFIKSNNSDGQNLYGQLLINPEVQYNSQPKAMVELISYSYLKDQASGKYAFQRFALPMAVVEDVTAENVDGGNAMVRFYNYDYTVDKWATIGYLNPMGGKTPELDPSELNKPFDYYQMMVYEEKVGTKITFYGRLVGNKNVTVTAPKNFKWVGFANSNMAYMNNETLLDALKTAGLEGEKVAIYRNVSISEHKYVWNAITSLDGLDENPTLNPMEAFLIKADAQGFQLELNYKDLIWTPNTLK